MVSRSNHTFTKLDKYDISAHEHQLSEQKEMDDVLNENPHPTKSIIEQDDNQFQPSERLKRLSEGGAAHRERSPGPQPRKGPGGAQFIKVLNLPESIVKQDLITIFSCKLILKLSSINIKGNQAFVELKNSEDLDLAMSLNGIFLKNRSLDISVSTQEEWKGAVPAEPTSAPAPTPPPPSQQMPYSAPVVNPI